MDKWALFLWNVCTGSLLAFFTTFVLVEGLLALFRIREGRFSALLRMIPILKLPFDLFLYDFSRWALLQGIDPLRCKEGTRMIMAKIGYWKCFPLSGIEFTAPGNTTFTVGDVLSGWIPLAVLIPAAFLLVGMSLVCFFRTIFAYCKFSRELSTHLTASPFVAGLISPKIFMPPSFVKKLTEKELQAVLAHENEHVRYRDTLTRIALTLIGSLFWWVPTQFLQKRIEEAVEIASDCAVRRRGIDPLDLASAMCKLARSEPSLPFAYHFAKPPLQKRVQALLQPIPKRSKRVQRLLFAAALWIAFSAIFLGKFWLF